MSYGKRGVTVKWQSEEVFGCEWLYSEGMGIKKRQTFLRFGVFKLIQYKYLLFILRILIVVKVVYL
jgi:hypothetical protein